MIERAVVDAITAAGDEPLAVATVVGARGSAYRRPGARLVFTRDRALAGSVSGGCLEDEIVRSGWWRTERGPVVVTYDGGDDDVRRGTGCDGSIDILIERVGQARIDPLAVLARCVDSQERASLVTVVASSDPRISLGAFAVLRGVTGPTRRTTRRTRGGQLDVMIEDLRPPPHMFVLGTGPDALAVADHGRAIGWRVIVVAPSLRPSLRARFSRADALFAHPTDALGPLTAAIDRADRAAVVVINHDLDRDLACLAQVLASRAEYIGVLGSRQRTEGMLADLQARTDLGVAADPRLHAPAGLALGAETPAEIALSIVAEAQAVLTRAAAGKLRDATGTIHAASEPALTGAVSPVSLRLSGCSAA